MNTIRDTIRQQLEDNLLYGKGDLTDDASLLEAGLIDSTGVLELVAFLESRFGIKVEDTDIVPANFDSVAGLVAYVQSRLRDAPARAAMADHAD
ncbi:acyl carrier protein [Falsiroseomonas sp. HW251]|uniref:acyl carrier protein n=1 Tax=Falsiroseomonas sp. HW251 TaxID=3390998 RepID=UPI003D318E19